MSSLCSTKLDFILRLEQLFLHINYYNDLNYDKMSKLTSVILDKGVSMQQALHLIFLKVDNSDPKVSERGVEVLHYVICQCDYLLKRELMTDENFDKIKNVMEEPAKRSAQLKLEEYIPIWIAIFLDAFLNDSQKNFMDGLESLITPSGVEISHSSSGTTSIDSNETAQSTPYQSPLQLTVFDSSQKLSSSTADNRIDIWPSSSTFKPLTCIICIDASRSYACVPCGHKIICDNCVTVFKRRNQSNCCPICRTKIQTILKIYD